MKSKQIPHHNKWMFAIDEWNNILLRKGNIMKMSAWELSVQFKHKMPLMNKQQSHKINDREKEREKIPLKMFRK